MKALGIGCLVIVILGVLVVAGGLIYLGTLPEGGVRLANNMEDYALAYLDEHQVLMEGEELVAYYDHTLRMTGTEASILTNKRVLHHKDGRTTAILLDDVSDIRHRQDALIGDIIEVYSKGDDSLLIEIAPLNQGMTFLNVLLKRTGIERASPSYYDPYTEQQMDPADRPSGQPDLAPEPAPGA